MKTRNSALILVLSSFIFVAAGCSFHKSRVSQPLINVPSAYAGVEGKEAPTAPIDEWWKQFEDNTLNTLMNEVFQHNLDIAAAYARLKQSRAVLQITDSSRGLILNIEGSGGRTRQSGSFGGRPSESVPKLISGKNSIHGPKQHSSMRLHLNRTSRHYTSVSLPSWLTSTIWLLNSVRNSSCLIRP
jgi:outer membrane protein TolC